MAKIAYLIITDMHMGNMVTNSRKDYRNEIFVVKKQLLETAIKYKHVGYDVVALFLGDIFHNSYKDVTEALIDKDFLTLWKLKVGDIYTVMGNHEFTYYKANPFYTTISQMESENVQHVVNRVWTPLGTSAMIRVIDELRDGEVVFYFNHYGTDIQQPTGDGIAIGLFHQEVIDPQIKEETEKNSGKRCYAHTTDIEQSGLLKGYKYCFFGHMHNVYGVWRAGDTYLHYLASLGRTNESEVNNEFLERNIPAVLVNDGKFIDIEDNFIQLLCREECIVESVVQKNRDSYARMKEISEIHQYVPFGDDPVENLRVRFIENPHIIGLLDELKNNDEDSRLKSIKRKMREFGIGYQQNQR